VHKDDLIELVGKMRTPVKSVPFPWVIEGISGHKVLRFDPAQNTDDQKVLEVLRKTAEWAGNKINDKGIVQKRANEVGNEIEDYVEASLNQSDFLARTPLSSQGKTKSVGYPDIEFEDHAGRHHYLECKTFNKDSIDTTFRSFYLSPSDDFKVTRDACHFLISYEIYVDGKSGKENIYKCRSWKILSLDQLTVSVKYEFNCDNKTLYAPHLILDHGNL
jgi:hypothetical protein